MKNNYKNLIKSLLVVFATAFVLTAIVYVFYILTKSITGTFFMGLLAYITITIVAITQE